MAEFSSAELQAAHKAISSSVRKIEKVKDTLSKKQPTPKSQITLASRNLAAFRLALALIEREMQIDEPE